MKTKDFGGGHLTRSSDAAGSSVEESMASHLAWMIKCQLTDFIAIGKYVFDILVLYCVYSSYFCCGSWLGTCQYGYGANLASEFYRI